MTYRPHCRALWFLGRIAGVQAIPQDPKAPKTLLIAKSGYSCDCGFECPTKRAWWLHQVRCPNARLEYERRLEAAMDKAMLCDTKVLDVPEAIEAQRETPCK